MHSKIKYIYYEKLEIQKYMTSPLFSNDEVDLLHALRSRSIDCKANFKQKYTNNNLLCSLCNLGYEDQPHILHCKEKLKIFETNEISQSNVKYEDLFSNNVHKQKVVTALYTQLLNIRDFLLKQRENPSTGSLVLRMSNNIHTVIVYLFFGI